MANLDIYWKGPPASVVKVQLSTSAAPAGFTKIATINHEHKEDPSTDPVPLQNHVLYHDIRDALYKQGVWDMQRITVEYNYPD